MSIDKTIRRVTNSQEQEIEAYRYWQSQSVGDRLTAVWDASVAAYAFAAAFKGAPSHDDTGYEGPLSRIEGQIDGKIPTCVISKDDLIRNKLASGREQDLLDAKKLRATGMATRDERL